MEDAEISGRDVEHEVDKLESASQRDQHEKAKVEKTDAVCSIVCGKLAVYGGFEKQTCWL